MRDNGDCEGGFEIAHEMNEWWKRETILFIKVFVVLFSNKPLHLKGTKGSLGECGSFTTVSIL